MIWRALKSLLRTFTVAQAETQVDDETTPTFLMRDGAVTDADEVFNASTSADLKRMLEALSTKSNAVDRHFLLMTIIGQTYLRRNDPEMRSICKRVARIHIDEFSVIAPVLKRQMDGVLPRVSTFQLFATVLTEDCDFEEAIQICKLAIAFSLEDGTKSGFSGRIDRIRRIMSKARR
jgi:hypothetical protein